MIDFLATSHHYAEHLRPIYWSLPHNVRGEWITGRPNLRELASREYPVCVSASGDLALVRRVGRQAVFCEHGAGQSYSSEHPSYAGGRGRENVILFLVPGPHPARRNREAWPGVPVVEIGCPKLDTYHLRPPVRENGLVCLSWHWDCKVCPETRTAWREFKPALRELAASDIKLVGHGHPRILKVIKWYYQRLGIEIFPSFRTVLERCNVYVCDNSSTIFEFASTGRPVVLLNSSRYRRNVSHGLRFWDASDVGLQCNNPNELISVIRKALEDPPEVAERRREAIRSVYTYTDGRAAERAAQAIMEVI